MRTIQRVQPASAEKPYCTCTGTSSMGFHPHPVRGDWYVHYDCNKPARTYLNAKEEQGDLWNDGVVLVQAPAKRLVRRRPS